jgi:hypothetical protein
MSEATLVRRIKKAVKAAYPRAFVAKLADRHTRGLPDLLILLPGVTLFVETKAPGGKLSPIQRAVHEEIERAGGYVLVARSVEDVLRCLEASL